MVATKPYFRIGACVFLWLLHTLVFAQPSRTQIQNVISDRVGSQVGSGTAGSIFGRLVKLELAIAQTRGQIARAAYQPDNNVYLQHFTDGMLLIWDFAQGAQIDEFRLSGGAVPVYYDAVTTRLHVIDGGRYLRISRPKEGAAVSEQVIPDVVQAAAASGDGRFILLGAASGEVIKINTAGAAVWRGKAVDSAVRQLVASRDGSRVTVLGDGGVAKVLDDKGATVSTLANVAMLGQYDRSGRQMHVLQNRELLTVSSQGVASNSRPRIDGEIQSISVSDSGDRLLAVSSTGALSIGSGDRWEPVDKGVKFGTFLSDLRYLSIRNDGVTHLRSQGLAHYLVAIVPGSAGWVIVDHEGRYDGTVDGAKDVKWNAETGTLGLDQFFEAYYQPGFLSAYLKEDEAKTLSALPGKLGAGVFLPPKIQLDFPEGRMKPGDVYKVVAVAESSGGDLVEEIKLYHNGKRLPGKARIGTQKIQKDNRLLLVQVFAFVPEAGPNEIFAEIRNAHGITGRSEVKREVTEGFRPTGKLHVLGVAIDKYRLSSMDLEFANADIKAFVNRVTAGAKGRYEQVVPRILADTGATHRGMKDLLENLAELDPQDSLILALAGHGDFHNGEWYFLPHDVDPKDIPGTGISARELQDALVNSPVRRIFLMVDACNSGAGIDSFNRYRAFQRRFAQQIGRNAGLSVLTATRRDQLAAEVPQLGHGLFTHTVLEGLSGAADNSPSDGRISAHELANFVGQNLERKARPFLESHRMTQSPAHFVIGSDFLISDVRR